MTLMVLLIASACIKETPHYEKEVSQVIIASNSDVSPDTKTCIGEFTNNASHVAILWTPEDELGVFTDKEQNVRYTKANRTSNELIAAFVASKAVKGTPQYAYYPYNEDIGTDITKLKGNVPNMQIMDPDKGTVPGDNKIGEYMERTDQGEEFKFTHLFSPIRIIISGIDTEVHEDLLEGINLTVTRDGSPVPVCGDFTFNAKTGEYKLGTTSNKITFDWSTKPSLGSEAYAYGTIFPEIKRGDKLTFVVRTSSHIASITATSKVDFKPNTIYTFPLRLSRFEGNSEFEFDIKSRPVITNFTFNVANNTDKLLDNQLVWNNSDQPQFNSISNYSPTITGSDLSFMIPYLYDFKLKPTFTVSDGCTATVGGQVVKSGETEIDFTKPVVFTVSSGEESREYTVTVANTGIPVVVLKHSKSGNFNTVRKNGLGKVLNKFVDFMIRGKDTDWVTDDQLTVYNADGSINLPTTNCGAKLRGNTSQEYPKKPFAIKLTDKAGAPILNMPAHNRWVLLANWLDHSMIRNTVAFDIAHAIEQAWRDNSSIGAGIPWNVHGQNVELVVFDKDGKGHHVGNYLLCEQIKTHENRLSIPKPYLDETCGHLLEVDGNYDEPSKFKTNKNVPFMFKDEVTAPVLSAVKTKVQSIESNLYNNNFEEAYKNLDINSVIDQWLIWELTMNREYGDPRSVYMFMDSNGKLCAGPVWDFDRATFQNTTLANRDGNDRVKPYNEWICWRTSESDTYSYIWYKQLIKDPIFQNTVKERWKVIYPSLTNLSTKIEGYRKSLRKSFDIDSKMWPTDDDAIHEHKNPFTDWAGDENINNWDDLIQNFIDVYEARLAGMNKLIQEENFTK